MKLEKNKDYLIYTGLFLAGWSLVLLILLSWSFKSSYDTLQHIALYKLRSYFSEAMEVREWSIKHGGIFETTAHQASSLNATDSSLVEVPLEDDRKPAAAKQASETRNNKLSSDYNDMQIRLTSLQSAKPEDRPDSWEKDALKSFDRGETEAFLMTADKQGNSIFRYTAPLPVDYTCITCHRDENFLLKKFNGAISIIAPAEPLIALRAAEARMHLIGYTIIWILGCGGIVLAMRKLMESSEQRIKQEKFIGVMEMAGAAAHELNQPLQVISGCTDIMLVSGNQDDENFIQLNRQVKDSVNKLAAITRKINKITRYVTMDYVGHTRIIDLDKATLNVEEVKQQDQPQDDRINSIAGI